MLLEKRPEFAPNCDKCNGWNSLSGDEWVELLKSQPQFADRCDRYNGWIKFSKLQWVSMQQLISSQLENQHQLSRNSEAGKRWMELNGHDWVQLLQRKPAFITKCGEYGGWDKISECKGWFELLKARSELFIEQCDHHNGWARLNAHQWVSLLKDHVKLSGKCDAANGWRTFTGFDWVVLLREQPFFLTKCQEWGGWASITECKCWCELLEVCPQFANKCDESRGWNTFDGFDWWRLLKAQTFFIEKCNEFNGWRQVYSCAFEAYGKQEAACSQIADYDWVFDSRHYDDFGYLRNPFLGICGKVGICGNDENLLKRVDSSFWIYTLKTNFASINSGYTSSPRMSIYDYRHFSDLGIWWRFTRDDWEQLACAYNGDVLNSIAPFVDERFWNALLKCWPTWFDDAQDEQKVHHWPIWDGYSQKVQAARCCMSRFSAWPYLLVYHPEYADACKDQNGWRSFEKNDWQRLIDSNFLGKVDRNALDAGFWFALLSKAPQFSKTCDEYNGWVALAPDNWFKLLIANSNFADRCNVWFQFDGEQWVELLKQNASFSGACDQSEGWTKFGKKDWLSLLLANRTFASKCEETGAVAKFGWNSIDEAIDDELERQRHRYDYLDDVLEPSPDWREESGWNDMYGDADPSDFIEFR